MDRIMRAHEIIGILVIPGRTEAEKSVGNLDTLWQDRCLRFCQALGEEKFENLLTDASLQGFGIRYCKSVDPRFSYVCSAIISLLRLHAEITELTSKFNSGLVTPVLVPPCIISASQRDKIIKLVQYVIALEVLPNLLPGVGIPLKKRSEYAHELLDQASASNVSDVEKYDRLSFTTRALLKIASDPNLGCLIYSTSLPDILAALLQLCYAPIKEPDPKSTCTLVTPVLYSRFMAERREFKSQLDHLIATVYRPPLIKSLLLLQGAPKNLDTLPKVGPLVIAPVWLRAVCAEKLTSCLMQYNGIIYVAEATLGYYCDGSVDLNRINAVSQLIATPPKEVGIHSYYRVIAPQVVSLLKTSNPQTQPAFLQLGFRIIQLMMEKNSEITYKFLLKPVFLPLLQCLDSTVSEKSEIPDEFQLSQCLEEVKKVFVDNAQPGESVQAYLKSILIVLFKIYSCVFYGASYLRSTVEEILLRSLQNNSTAENIQVFELLAFNRLEKGMFPLKKGLTFKSGEEGGIVATFDENEENWLVSDDEKAIIIVDLMTKQGDSETLSQFFLHLLKRLGSIIDPLEEDSDPEGDDFESKLLRIEKQLDDKMFKLKESLMVVRLISLLSESEGIQDVIMKDQVKVVEFTKMTLQRVAIQIEESAERQLIDKESVCLAIGVLASLTSSASKVKNSLWDQLQTVVPDLDNLMNRHPDQEVRECAEDLKIVIASRGIYTNEMAKRMRKEKTKLEKEKKIVEELSNKEAVFENLKNVVIDPAIKLKEEVMNLYPNKKDDESIKEGFKEALEYLNDPMIPVKGHGLILLSKLVQNKDTPTIENKEKLLNIFKEHLSHEDSYIYLAAIRGLVVLGDQYPDEVLSTISQEASNSKRQEDVRAKFAEALVGVLRSLGELTPKFKDRILNLLLAGVQDKSVSVRVSSMSALGEALKNLKDSVGSICHEITTCLLGVLRSLDESSVKSAAVLCITYLLQGQGSSALEVLKDSIGEIHRELRRLLATEKDNQLIMHTNLALDELDTIMKSFLDLSQQPMKKEIFISSLPK